jgi:hypothetical protein
MNDEIINAMGNEFGGAHFVAALSCRAMGCTMNPESAFFTSSGS